MPERLISRRDTLKAITFGIGLICAPTLLSACDESIETGTPIDKVDPLAKTGTPQRQNTETPTQIAPSATQPTKTEQQPTSTTVEIARDPTKWKEWPIVPEWIDPKIIDIYTRGISGGITNPHAFSKAGDCESVPTNGFLFGQFDVPGGFNLGKHSDLAATIKWFSGSWSRFPPTVHGGQNAAGILVSNSLVRYDNNHQQECSPKQSYLDCEVEQWHPSLLLISYEQELDSLDNYKKYLTAVVTYALYNNIVPIVATCANSEVLNGKVAEVAVENNIPVWNFWRAVQPLKHIFDQKLNDGFHLSWGGVTKNFDFADPNPTAWNVRNLTGAEAIKAVLEKVNSDFRIYERNF